jgi:retron-type reverse transcriptase
VPKKVNPEKVTDFRPISLLNSTMKFLTKILSNILEKVILKVIYRNQYGFIEGRTIQDCLGWAFEYLYQCHASKERLLSSNWTLRRPLTWLSTTLFSESYRPKVFQSSGAHGSPTF